MRQLWDSDQVAQLHISELDPFAVRAAGRQRLRLVVRQLSDGSFVTMPAAVLSDGRDSPRMVLVAGQHGDEWNGPWILHRLANLLNPDEVHGTLVILPITNPLAFNEGRRVSAVDSIDLNRSYGGGRPRKPTEHLGALLWKSVFSRTDYLIDLHSGGPGEYLPFAAPAASGPSGSWPGRSACSPGPGANRCRAGVEKMCSSERRSRASASMVVGILLPDKQFSRY